MGAATGGAAQAYRGPRRETGQEGMAGHTLAIHAVAPGIPPHGVPPALGQIAPEDVHLVLHGTRLLWL
jgi:hypothetical protein